MPVMIQVRKRQVNRIPGDMVIARCDSVRCRNTVVSSRDNWHTTSPTKTAKRIPGTLQR